MRGVTRWSVLGKKSASKTFGKLVSEEDGPHGQKNVDREKHSSCPVRSKFFDTDPLIPPPPSPPSSCVAFLTLQSEVSLCLSEPRPCTKEEESLCGWIGGEVSTEDLLLLTLSARSPMLSLEAVAALCPIQTTHHACLALATPRAQKAITGPSLE